MKIQQRVPVHREIELTDLLDAFDRVPPDHQHLAPFNETLVAFCHDVSQSLFKSREARAFPEILSLAFWLRQTSVRKMKNQFLHLQAREPEIIRVPRGVVLHIPPSNVDTIFTYSWFVSLLMGNRNLVRLSQKESSQTNAVCAVLNQVLAQSRYAVLRRNVSMVQYGHLQEVTALLSGRADVRMIWGGDETVSSLRQVPIRPHAKDLTFADRFSLSLIGAKAYLAMGDSAHERLAQAFFVDAFWYDQMGCSSPKLLVWLGTNALSAKAGVIFFDHLDRAIRQRAYRLEAGAAMNKLLFACGAAITIPDSRTKIYNNELTVCHLSKLSAFDRTYCGGGFFFEAALSDPRDLASFVTQKDQTLTYAGIEKPWLERLVRLANGRGLDRIVPIGQALAFHSYWDGYDLFRELTKVVHIRDSAEGSYTPPSLVKSPPTSSRKIWKHSRTSPRP